MKTLLTSLALFVAVCTSNSASAQVAPSETQALSKQLTQLMRNPKKPKQDVQLNLNGCSAEQVIRDRDADVQMTKPLAVSYGGNSGWAVKVDNGIFEMKMGLNWADVTSLTYEPSSDSDGQKYFEIKITKAKKNDSSSFEFPLYTTNETTVKDVVRRLDKVRRSCAGN